MDDSFSSQAVINNEFDYSNVVPTIEAISYLVQYCDQMNKQLTKLVEEDPTLVVETNQETGQTILRGMGELHLDIIMDRLKREFGLEINQGKPQVAYKETITSTVEHREDRLSS